MVKNPPASAGDVRYLGLIPGLVRTPGGGHIEGVWTVDGTAFPDLGCGYRGSP